MLEEFDSEIKPRTGQRLQHVDVLCGCLVMIVDFNTLTERMKNAQMKDYQICALKEALGKGDSQGHFIRSDILHKFLGGHEHIVVLGEMQTELIKLVHKKNHCCKNRRCCETRILYIRTK